MHDQIGGPMFAIAMKNGNGFNLKSILDFSTIAMQQYANFWWNIVVSFIAWLDAPCQGEGIAMFSEKMTVVLGIRWDS